MKKYVMMSKSKVRHDVKKYVFTLKSTSCHQEVSRGFVENRRVHVYVLMCMCNRPADDQNPV